MNIPHLLKNIYHNGGGEDAYCAWGRMRMAGKMKEGAHSRMRRRLQWEMHAIATWDIVELFVVEYVREVLRVDLGRVAVDLYARRGLAGQHPHPERQLLALKG